MSLFLKIIRKCGQGFSSFNNSRSSSVIYDKVKFNLTLLNQLCCIGGVLSSQKLARSEDECTGNGDLRLICGHTRKDRIRNNDIQNKAGVTSIVEKMRLKWFRHVKKRCTDPLVRRYERLGYGGFEERKM